jgi:hypothetical protein
MKDARAAYAAIVSEYFRPEEMSRTAFMAKVLGHGSLDLFTAESYVDFRLVGETRREIRVNDRVALQGQLRSLERARQRETDPHEQQNLDFWIADLKRVLSSLGFHVPKTSSSLRQSTTAASRRRR